MGSMALVLLSFRICEVILVPVVADVGETGRKVLIVQRFALECKTFGLEPRVHLH